MSKKGMGWRPGLGGVASLRLSSPPNSGYLLYLCIIGSHLSIDLAVHLPLVVTFSVTVLADDLPYWKCLPHYCIASYQLPCAASGTCPSQALETDVTCRHCAATCMSYSEAMWHILQGYHSEFLICFHHAHWSILDT
jgi:hypothetical protein